MKKLPAVLLLLFPVIVLSQTHLSRKRALGITFSPEYSYRFLTSPAEYVWIKDLRDGMEIPIFGYTVGFNWRYQFRKKFILSAGTSYSNKGEATKKSDLVYIQQNNNNPESVRQRYSYGFCELPLKIEYHFFDSTSYYLSAGVMLDVPVFEKRKSFYTDADGSVTKSTESSFHSTERISLSGMLGVGYYFSLGEKYLLKTEPFLKCNLTPGIGTNVKEYLYAVGIDLGLYIGY